MMLARTSLKTRVLTPLAAALLLLFGAYATAFYWEERKHIAEEFQRDLRTFQRTHHSVLKREADKLGAVLDAIVTRPDLQAALAAGDRRALLELSAPLFRQLHDRYGISHFYFSDANRVNLLRVHQPPRHGDRIDRHTTLTAEATGQPAWGAELGPLGTFTLRHVFPWRAEGRLIGYVELGEEIDAILQELPRRLRMDYVITLDKRRLDRQRWEEGMRVLNRSVDWDRLPMNVVAAESLSGVPTGLLAAPVKGDFEATVGGKRHRAVFLPLTDAAGGQVGQILLLRDMSERLAHMHAAIYKMAAVSLAIGLALLAFFAFILNRIEGRLEASRRRLAEEAEARQAMQAQHIAELQEQYRRVEQTNREWSTAFDAVQDPMFMHDRDLRLLRANRAYLERAGLPAAVLGRPYWEVFPKLPGPMASCLRAMETQTEEAEELALEGGEVFLCRNYPIRDGEGAHLYSLHIMHDITERKRYERELERQANYDGLTGLANRNLLTDRIQQAAAHSQRSRRQAAVLLMDLDRFKMINDSLGHNAGDSLLRAVAQRLAERVRQGDTVARLGGDEFVIVMEGLAREDDAVVSATKILEALRPPFTLAGREVFVTVSLGIALCPRNGEQPEPLLKNADAAMYQAKRLGGNGFKFFTEEMNTWAVQHLELETALRHALERGELELHYQPKVDLASGRISGAEALIRWRHPGMGLVSPGDFIPLAEETGLIVPIGEWVIETACAQIRAWQDAGLPPIGVAVNLSARQFREPNLPEVIAQALRLNDLPPRFLELELTESMLMHDPEQAAATLHRLKALGLRLALDDFGTGYSSLGYLKRFPIDSLKIDRSFVRDITSDPDDAAIARSVISLAHSMGLGVVAEGVETEGQLHYLRRHSCDELQGYYFSRPLPADDLARLLQEGKTLEREAEGGRTLLILDDEAYVLEALKRLLAPEGYRILTAQSPAEGFELLAAHDIRVVVCDQRMPGMDGTEFLGRVRKLHPETVRILLSGHTDLAALTDAVNRGAIYKFISKPWNDETLRETVRAAFRDTSPRSAGPAGHPPQAIHPQSLQAQGAASE